MTEEKREPCFWTCDDTCGRLHHEDPNDAIEEALDSFAKPGQTRTPTSTDTPTRRSPHAPAARSTTSS